MKRAFQFIILIVATFAIAQIFNPALTPAQAQGVKQIQLSEKQIQNFIVAQKEISKLAEKMQNTPGAQPDPKAESAIQAITQKNGFADINEYNDVFDNISIIMAGLDPKTKAFSEPKVAIQKEINEVKADPSIPGPLKKQQLEELDEALKVAEPIKFTSNIELVKKYYDQIDAAMQ
jgi:hypothetical protein